jgi:hypothetical protein
MAQQDIKSSLATKTTITANVATASTQTPQETAQPTQATTANQATNKNTATVTVTAPAPTAVKQDTTVNYNFDTSINTYLKTVKYLIDNFDGKKIPVESVGVNMTLSAWQAIKNIVIRAKDEDFTQIMEELNKLFLQGTEMDKCFADNRIHYYSNSFISAGKLSKDDLRAFELMITTMVLLANKQTRKLTIKQVILDQAFKGLRNDSAVQRLITYYNS